jgi:trimeric autotransporter adhesin
VPDLQLWHLLLSRSGDSDQDEPGCKPSCGCYASPIIVDTTGHGFHLTSAEDGVRFDIYGTEHPLKMAWTERNSGNAFLALDRNHNRKIDNGKELFGNYTEQPPCEDGTRACLNGYRALAESDKPKNGGNGDGIIDSRDAVYSKL